MDERLVKITIWDNKGNNFSRDYKDTNDKRDAIRWTLESGDVPHYLNIGDISRITVTPFVRRSKVVNQDEL